MSSDDRLRVALDMSPVLMGNTGVARYATELWRALSARGDLDTHSFAVGRGIHPPAVPIDRRVAVPLRVLHPMWRALRRPRAEDLVGDVDVVHSIDLVPPPTARPVVMTCHDVLPLTHPHLYDRRYRRLAARHVDALRRADAVVTTCKATASEIARVTGIDRSLIHVASPGVSLPEPAAGTDASGPAEPFLLYVGALTPRKGIERLVGALGRMREPPPLVVAGPPGMRADAVDASLATAPAHLRIDRRGAVTDAELAGLLRSAAALCHPSEAEGFGIPVLEAMAAGTVVIAGDIPPVREIGGDAIELVPVDDIEAWASTIERIVADPAQRDVLGSRARARVAGRTWDSMAASIVEIYRPLVR